MVELIVILADQPFPAVVGLPHPFPESALELLLLVTGGLGGRTVDDLVIRLRVMVVDRWSPEI